MPHNPEVVAAASDFMSIVLVGISYFGLFRAIMSLLRGSGHTTQGMIMSSSRLWLLRIPMTIFFAFSLGMGAIGVWTGMALSNMISAGIALAFYLKGDWKVKVVRTEKVPPLVET
jgi:Na+-driven multidrug efflux pump